MHAVVNYLCEIVFNLYCMFIDVYHDCDIRSRNAQVYSDSQMFTV